MICLRCYYKYYYVTLSSVFLILCLNVYLVFFFSKDDTYVADVSYLPMKYNG